ncbi:pyrimidine dimer DNA glycosylase/endonuclease V [Paenibacillus elgii]|uniref:pyrimidine dimer DNA glycosylase/endonuclease V n=1 Tax=Paenibacillus elgii TaxID=189691 RepID=UPI000248D64D|nr:pyrimidine dimer DNA glycosylase/endonuclease V [Paenibacillus elgii]
MRLWHQQLIPYLPSVKDYKGSPNQLGGQHTEIRMILGSIKKHGKVNHSTVNYVNSYPLSYLKAYGLLVIDEMKNRGFNVSSVIIDEYMNDEEATALYVVAKNGQTLYQEHDDIYLVECLENLKSKGIELEFKRT